MKNVNKTKKQLIDEINTLQARNAELEIMEKEVRQAHRDFGERMGRYFPQVNHMKEAVYVIFDRKYEFISDEFARMFGFTKDEVCHERFDLMKLVAPECRSMIQEKYTNACCSNRAWPSTGSFDRRGIFKGGTLSRVRDS